MVRPSKKAVLYSLVAILAGSLFITDLARVVAQRKYKNQEHIKSPEELNALIVKNTLALRPPSPPAPTPRPAMTTATSAATPLPSPRLPAPSATKPTPIPPPKSPAQLIQPNPEVAKAQPVTRQTTSRLYVYFSLDRPEQLKIDLFFELMPGRVQRFMSKTLACIREARRSSAKRGYTLKLGPLDPQGAPDPHYRELIAFSEATNTVEVATDLNGPDVIGGVPMSSRWPAGRAPGAPAIGQVDCRNIFFMYKADEASNTDKILEAILELFKE